MQKFILKKISVSNLFIIISAIFTIIATINSDFYIYGMNSIFLAQGQYHIYALQFFSSQFLHGWILHLIMNVLFIFIFWNAVENILWVNKYVIFFVFSSIFIGLIITLLWSWNTIWISGFAMAVMAYYTLFLRSRNNPDYKWWITALVLNIWIGLSPWISLLGHLFWAIGWVIYFYIIKLLKK